MEGDVVREDEDEGVETAAAAAAESSRVDDSHKPIETNARKGRCKSMIY